MASLPKIKYCCYRQSRFLNVFPEMYFAMFPLAAKVSIYSKRKKQKPERLENFVQMVLMITVIG